MPLARVKFRLLCPTQADAVTVQGVVVTRLGAKSRVNDLATTVAFTQSGWAVIGSFRFTTRADAEDLYAFVQTRWNGANSAIILAGSMVSFHMCSHGDAASTWADCSTLEFTAAVKP